MDSIFKTFNLGFLIRSVFAGGYFILSYYVVTNGEPRLSKVDGWKLMTTAFPIALFVGVSAYAIHRSLIFPVLEFFFDAAWATRLRSKCAPISDYTLKTQFKRWRLSVKEVDFQIEVGRRLTVWADYTQLQYTSLLCLILGSIVGCYNDPNEHESCGILIALGFVLGAAALLSDWRLRRVEESREDMNLTGVSKQVSTISPTSPEWKNESSHEND
jgi:hypothetical protein